MPCFFEKMLIKPWLCDPNFHCNTLELFFLKNREIFFSKMNDKKTEIFNSGNWDHPNFRSCTLSKHSFFRSTNHDITNNVSIFVWVAPCGSFIFDIWGLKAMVFYEMLIRFNNEIIEKYREGRVSKVKTFFTEKILQK